jgi:hypothetical protein
MPYRAQILDEKAIFDRIFLSRLLEYLLYVLQRHQNLSLDTLSYDTRIPKVIWLRLLRYYHRPEWEDEITAHDFHVAFFWVQRLYPTVRFWWEENGEVYIEM